MDSRLQELTTAVTRRNNENIRSQLQTILPNAANMKVVGLQPFDLLLAIREKDILVLTFQCLAELSKVDNNRKIFTDKVFLATLVNVCDTLDVDNILNYARAIGNIAYENDEARDLIGVTGFKKFWIKIKQILDTWNENKDQGTITAIFGSILNIIMGNDALQKVLLEENILRTVEQILTKISGNFTKYEDCISYIVHIISFVTDHMADEWISTNLCISLISILKVSENPEVSVLCLGILRQQSENDDLKTCLAINGTCEIIYELVQKYGSAVDDDESRAALKIACDLIVLVLTGDEAMKLLYDSGKGKVYQQMISWMDSTDADLISTAVLAIGNFARNDVNCIEMVDCGLFKKLINLLDKNNGKEADVKIQHALLSTLRHLSIPPQNKAKLLHENIIDIMYTMIDNDNSPVVYKLMGTFRMLVDGQEDTARKLLNRKEFLEKIAYWCYNSDHVGVRAEAPRLLAWLIKNSHSFDAFPIILSIPDCVKCLIEMIASSHGIMQNESLLSLNLIAAFCLASKPDHELTITKQLNNLSIQPDNYFTVGDTVEVFVKADIGKNLNFMLANFHDKLSFEITSNLLQLIDRLCQSPVLVDHLKLCRLGDSLSLLLTNKNIGGLKEKVESLLKIFADFTVG